MKFDTIIIGGGLTGLASGIALLQKGQRVAIVSFGQTLLHFMSGSLSGVANDGNNATSVTEVKQILATAGVGVIEGGYRLTPLGNLKPAALTLEGFYHTATGAMPEKNVAVVQIPGYLGLPIEFLTVSLTAQGKAVQVVDVAHLSACTADVILVPACKAGYDLYKQHGGKVRLIAAMPPSVPGAALHTSLVATFQRLGGFYIDGDKAVSAEIEAGIVKNITTERLADERLMARHYLLATGSFQSEGLQSNYEKVWEPIFGADIDAPATRPEWTDPDFFADQPYQHIGVRRDDEGRALIAGQPISNLYPVGHILGGVRSDITNLNEALAVCRKLV